VFTLGGSFSGGIGNKNGEIWRPETQAWTYLPNVEADGSMNTDDDFGVQVGEYVFLFVVPAIALTNNHITSLRGKT
jgi:hypothetical protein